MSINNFLDVDQLIENYKSIIKEKYIDIKNFTKNPIIFVKFIIYDQKFVNLECCFKIYLHKIKCFDLSNFFTKNKECILDPCLITKYINIGDVIIIGTKRVGFCFVIVVDINKTYKLITVLRESNGLYFLKIKNTNEKYYKNITFGTKSHSIKLCFNNFKLSKIFSYYDAVFMCNKIDSKNYYKRQVYVCAMNLLH